MSLVAAMRWLAVVVIMVLAGCAGDGPSGEPGADRGPDAHAAEQEAEAANETVPEPVPEPVREDLFADTLAADFGYDAEVAGCEAIPVLAVPKAVLGDDPLAGTDHDSFEVEEAWWHANFTFTADAGPDVTIAWVNESFSAIELHRVSGGSTLNGTIPEHTAFGGYVPCEPEAATASVAVYRFVGADAP